MTRPSAPTVDHRVRVGAQRRENMRMRLLQIAQLVRVGRDRGGEADLEEVTGGLALALAVEAGDRAEIDHERAHAPQ